MNDRKEIFFKKAIPVWARGKETEVNSCIELACNGEEVSEGILRITGATFYQVYAGSKLIHYGPARKADGYSAVDTIKLPIMTESDEFLIRAVGYNCRSFNSVTRSSFLRAEIEIDGKVEKATGFDGFVGYEAKYHRQKAMRYSYQRQFSEIWDFTFKRVSTKLAAVNKAGLLVDRAVPYADLSEIWADKPRCGRCKRMQDPKLALFPYLTNPAAEFTHFPYDELDSYAYAEYLKTKCDYSNGIEKNRSHIAADECMLYDFGKIRCGFFRLKVKVKEKVRIILAFSEQLDEWGSPAMRPLNSVNVIEWTLPEGEYDMTSLEPYTVKYAEVIATEGKAEIEGLGVCQAVFPKDKMKREAFEDTELSEIYTAAVETFRHNTLDVFMDCPSRERAGWLFDSFYTAKAEYYFTGSTEVEKAFLNNYLHGRDVHGQDGMVNMCYPADVFTNNYVPQWAMWYVLEVNEYINLRKGKLDIELFEKQAEKLLKWFSKYENEYGLLERLGGWNFIEWSDVNNRVFDVSYATNMLYYKMIRVMGEMFDRSDLIEKSDEIKKKIIELAFDGTMFCDRAVRNNNGILENTNERSEVTQYYALRFNIAHVNDEKFSELAHMVFDVFGPDRTVYPEIERADSMPGIYLRMELLNIYGKYSQLLAEIKDYFLGMARETGTLWERYEGKASRDHGFASYVAVAISEACRGMDNQANKTI